MHTEIDEREIGVITSDNSSFSIIIYLDTLL